ncbi:MAG: DUF4055 domain-containing protein [Lysobacteraceae bacterium]
MTTKVDTVSDAVAGMQGDWQLIADLLGGTRAMRAAGERYLPKRPMEEASDYAARLGGATLFPALAETIKRLVGRVFSEPVGVNDDVPAWIAEEVLPDVDRQGRNLHVFAKEWFDEALSYGVSHVLVESPRADGVRTRADQRAAGLRPYLIRIHPERMLGWRETDGQLTQVRIRFDRTEDAGQFGTRRIEQVRVYEIGRVQTWEKNGEGEWALVDDIATGLPRIPLIALYTQRTGMLTATPPLRELAHLNVKHWRMQSSNDTLIDTASVPILALSGVQDGDDVLIGAKHAVRLPPGAAMQYVEHSGAAIEAGRRALLDLVEEMRQAGAKLLQPVEGNRTATEAREDASNDNSTLGGMATQLQDTLNDVLDLIAEYRGEAAGGTVQLNPNLDPELDTATAITDLLGLYREGIVSRPTVFEAAKRFGRVPDTVIWEDEQTLIGEDGPALGAL